jgi:hypothetical protein
MHMKQNPDSSVFPAVRRQLVDLDGPLFKVFSEVGFCIVEKYITLI